MTGAAVLPEQWLPLAPPVLLALATLPENFFRGFYQASFSIGKANNTAAG